MFYLPVYVSYCTQYHVFDSASTKTLFWSLAGVSHLLDDVLTDIVYMGTHGTPSGGTGGELWYPQPNSVEKYIHLHITKIDPRLLATVLSGEAFAMCTSYDKTEETIAGWIKR